MTDGIKVWDANGNLVFDANTLTPRKFASFQTTTSDGTSASYTIPDASQAVAVVRDASATVEITRSGNAWQWKYGGIPSRLRVETDVDIWLY